MAAKVRRGDQMEDTLTAEADGGPVAEQSKQQTGQKSTGLTIQRHFTQPNVDPFDTVEWEKRSAVISGENGEVVFEQHEVDIPKSWSQLATNVVVSKYFRGPLGTPQRESSVRQMIGRVVSTITTWGKQGGYFAGTDDAQAFSDELTHLLVRQKLAFNSPVWFNVGVEPHPQCSACFILSVNDTMDSILDWYRREGVIFKGGSGSGVNLSAIRSSKEQLGAEERRRGRFLLCGPQMPPPGSSSPVGKRAEPRKWLSSTRTTRILSSLFSVRPRRRKKPGP